jgi:hypothetical protein
MRLINIFLAFGLSLGCFAGESNSSNDANLTQKNLEEQMKREAKYAREKAFYQGKDYNLSERTVDPKTISNIPTITPEDDFDMDDVYSDIQ